VTTPFELPVGDGDTVRGDALAGDEPGYLYLHGLGSVRQGEKSNSLLVHARTCGRAFLRVDQRGHGASTGQIGEVTIGELITDLQRVLERTGPRRIVGSSLGGLVAAFAAAARPELVAGLCLMAPALGFLTDLERHLDADGKLWTSNGIGFRVSARVLADARRLEERHLPEQLSMPVLLVHGTADTVVSQQNSERFFRAIPHAAKELWLVPDGDHRLNTVAAEVWPRLDNLIAAN